MTNSTVRRASAAVLGVLLAVGGTALAAPAAAAPPEKQAVIVTLTPGSDAAAESRRAAANGGGSVTHVYSEVFRGFAGSFNERALEGLRGNPRVTLIEADGVATVSDTQTTPLGSGLWGLDRIDDKTGVDGTYVYPAATSTTVTAYVVDTGVALHDDFARRAPGKDVFSTTGDGTNDCNGHGTHVAGTVAGTTHGVAKNATVVPVRVLDCNGSGSWSGVIAGLDWIVGNHGPNQPAVANMSLGGSRNSSVDAAVSRVISDGVTVAVAAGNDGRDACNYSPARVPAALTTGATDVNDYRASWSNYGSCLDLFAPGVGVTSSWIGSATATNTISGTSMATPHVAGAVAVLLAGQPGLTTTQVADTIRGLASTSEVLSAGRRSPNRLLYSPPPVS